jgi:hypothetical protein
MKPSITIDARGALLNVTLKDDQVVSIPLEAATVRQVSSILKRARDSLQTPKGRATLVRGLGKILSELATSK